MFLRSLLGVSLNGDLISCLLGQGLIEAACTLGMGVGGLSEVEKRWVYLQNSGLWSKVLLLKCHGWVEILLKYT